MLQLLEVAPAPALSRRREVLRHLQGQQTEAEEMRSAKRWRYYCDFCSKAVGSRGVMEKHEKGCTNNPNRVCGMHEFGIDVEQKPLAELTAAMITGGLPALREAAGNCPACILATIRQTQANWPDDFLQRHAQAIGGFDFRKEVAAFWEAVNEVAP